MCLGIGNPIKKWGGRRTYKLLVEDPNGALWSPYFRLQVVGSTVQNEHGKGFSFANKYFNDVTDERFRFTLGEEKTSDRKQLEITDYERNNQTIHKGIHVYLTQEAASDSYREFYQWLNGEDDKDWKGFNIRLVECRVSKYDCIARSANSNTAVYHKITPLEIIS